MAMFYRFSFTVEGFGAFPTDMLRYDNAFPHSESDSSDVDAHNHRTVQLVAIHDSRAWRPTYRRWESFGWKVIECEEAAKL